MVVYTCILCNILKFSLVVFMQVIKHILRPNQTIVVPNQQLDRLHNFKFRKNNLINYFFEV